jgi:apolipoprotein N-acyltransferase
LLALLSACLQVLIFPRAPLNFLCWIAVTPLLYALLRGRGGEGEMADSEGRSLRPFSLMQGFMIGWFCGTLWFIGSCYWIISVMHGYGGVNWVFSVLIMLAFCLILGMHQGAFGLLVVWMGRRSSAGNRLPLLLAPFFWVAIEFFRDRVTPVPWDPLGNSQVANIPFTRIASFTGVYGLSFAIILVNCAFAAALLLPGRRRRLNLLISATAAAIALQMGVFAKPAPFATTKEAVLLQPNIPISDLAPWTQQGFDKLLRDQTQLSVHAKTKNPPGSPGLIVWPESPVSFADSDTNLRHTLKAMAQDTNSFLIIGVTGTTGGGNTGRAFQEFNSALVVDSRGNEVGRYDKIHLVPFGEYVPLKDLLFFARKLTHEAGNFSRGTERKVFDLNGDKAGIAICYESIFPEEIREFSANGAQVLVNISNDTWFGESGAPYQHLDMTRMRAIEAHRWVLLSTNNGVTASIDPYGRIVKKAERNTAAALVAPYGTEMETTFYVRYGDLFAWICVVISCLALLVRPRISAGTMLEARTT